MLFIFVLLVFILGSRTKPSHPLHSRVRRTVAQWKSSVNETTELLGNNIEKTERVFLYDFRFVAIDEKKLFAFLAQPKRASIDGEMLPQTELLF